MKKKTIKENKSDKKTTGCCTDTSCKDKSQKLKKEELESTQGGSNSDAFTFSGGDAFDIGGDTPRRS